MQVAKAKFWLQRDVKNRMVWDKLQGLVTLDEGGTADLHQRLFKDAAAEPHYGTTSTSDAKNHALVVL